MERTPDCQPIIDLGAASVETKGPDGDVKDEQSFQILVGLSDA
jgi:hypothetical protein